MRRGRPGRVRGGGGGHAAAADEARHRPGAARAGVPRRLRRPAARRRGARVRGAPHARQAPSPRRRRPPRFASRRRGAVSLTASLPVGRARNFPLSLNR